MEETAELKRSIKQITSTFDFNAKELNVKELQNVKRVVKSNPDFISHLYHELCYYLKQRNSELRYAVLLLCDYFFQRSHLFRLRLTESLQEFFIYTVEVDPSHHILPAPRKAANILKIETLKYMKKWHEKFSEGYPKLNFAYNYLQRTLRFVDLERDSNLQQDEQSHGETAERRSANVSKQMINRTATEFTELRGDVQRCIDGLRSALDLLVSQLCSSNKTHSTYDNNINEAAHGPLSTSTSEPVLSSSMPIFDGNNKTLITTIIHYLKLSRNYDKLLTIWLSKVTKWNGTEAKIITKELSFLKKQLTVELLRCEDLRLVEKICQGYSANSESCSVDEFLNKLELVVDSDFSEVSDSIIEKNDLKDIFGTSSTSSDLKAHQINFPTPPHDYDSEHRVKIKPEFMELLNSKTDAHRIWPRKDQINSGKKRAATASKNTKEIKIRDGLNGGDNNDKLKRKRNKLIFSESSTSRHRLSAKLFNRSSLKRVCETLDSMQKKRASCNFASQFNYVM